MATQNIAYPFSKILFKIEKMKPVVLVRCAIKSPLGQYDFFNTITKFFSLCNFTKPYALISRINEGVYGLWQIEKYSFECQQGDEHKRYSMAHLALRI